jgi:hypothetical protein
MEDDGSNDPTYVAATGRRLLKRPSKDLLKRVYNGSTEAFRKCVISNFPGCDQNEEISNASHSV